MRKSEHSTLKALSVDELINLREAADGLIRRRLRSEKQDLQSKLARIAKYEKGFKKGLSDTLGSGLRPKPARHVRSKVAPKYKDPESGQTWAGRGLQPRWLREAIASGKSASDFLIRAAAPH